MTNTQATPNNGGTNVLTTGRNVISVSFDPDNNAFAALTALKELDEQDRLKIESAAVITRGDDGQIVVKDHVGSVEYAGAASGGILGLLIGILGGPLGVLIGGTYGLMVGSLFDLDDAERSESALSQMSAAAKPGRIVLLAELDEQSPELVDTAMAPLGGTVLRRSAYDVESEVAAAEEAQRKAKHEANKELMRSRKEHSQEQAHAKVEQLKAKLPGREKASA